MPRRNAPAPRVFDSTVDKDTKDAVVEYTNRQENADYCQSLQVTDKGNGMYRIVVVCSTALYGAEFRRKLREWLGDPHPSN